MDEFDVLDEEELEEEPQEEEESDYWAAKKDPSEFTSEVHERIRKYWDHLERTRLYARIRRSWKYYHNLFYDEDSGEREIRTLGEEGELAGLSVNHTRSSTSSRWPPRPLRTTTCWRQTPTPRASSSPGSGTSSWTITPTPSRWG